MGVLRGRRFVVTAAVVALLAACGSNGDSVGAGEAEPEPSLSGTSWVSTEVEGYELLSATAVLLDFSDGQVSASAGCNTLSGDYSLDGDRLVIAGGLASTEMGCSPPERHDQDEWLADLLETGSAVEIRDRSMVLVSGEVTVRFVDESVVDPDRDLTGVTWAAETLIDGETASNLPVDVEAPTFQVAEDGSAELFTGCSDASGTARAADDVLELALMVPDGDCEGAAGEVEDHVMEVLGGAAAAFEIEGSKLRVSAGEMAVEFRAE